MLSRGSRSRIHYRHHPQRDHDPQYPRPISDTATVGSGPICSSATATPERISYVVYALITGDSTVLQLPLNPQVEIFPTIESLPRILEHGAQSLASSSKQSGPLSNTCRKSRLDATRRRIGSFWTFCRNTTIQQILTRLVPDSNIVDYDSNLGTGSCF